MEAEQETSARMGGKKIQHHTAGKLAAKAKESLTNKGGGKAGKADRMGGAAGHSRFECKICKTTAPSMKTLEVHFESKHPTIPLCEVVNNITDLHAANGGVTTQGIAVKGSNKVKGKGFGATEKARASKA